MIARSERESGRLERGLLAGDRVALVRGLGMWSRRVRAGEVGVVVAVNDLGEAEVHFDDQVELVDPASVRLVGRTGDLRSA
jgi:dihydroxyacid dehydratase/phosphogluconate dehydratase